MPAQLAKPGFDLGIVTAQIDDSLRFYRDLVGLEPITQPLHSADYWGCIG
jgi:hypothetical protein